MGKNIHLKAACADLTKRLDGVENRCGVIHSAICEFEDSGRSIAPAIKLKLEILRFWIVSSELDLYHKHEWQGCVYITVNDQEGILVRWYEKDTEWVNEALQSSWGRSSFWAAELSDLILKLEQDLTDGNWAEAVAWLNRFGWTYGKDFRKLPSEQDLQTAIASLEKRNKHATKDDLKDY